VIAHYVLEVSSPISYVMHRLKKGTWSLAGHIAVGLSSYQTTR
jgi:hypothetical protein